MKLDTLEEQLAAVKDNGYVIKHIKNPCLEVQIEAVKNNGYAIKYIKDPHLEVQLTAVKQDGLAIEYIKNPFPEVQIPEVQKLYFLSCLKGNYEINYNYIKDLDPTWMQNMIDCKDILE